MVKRRAISKDDKALEPQNLPLLFKALVPVLNDRHSGLFLSAEKSYEFAGAANAIPLAVEEFPMALQNYPIVFSGGAKPVPLALVGFVQGVNDFVDAAGAWKDGAYVPAYLRRYPFAFVRESQEGARNILCADLTSTMFEPQGHADRALFQNGETGGVLKTAMDFCNRYETAMARTRAAMDEFVAHGLIGPSTVSITKDGKTIKVEGFQTLSEEKLRALPDDVLASFVRRGISTIISAHLISLSKFASMSDVS